MEDSSSSSDSDSSSYVTITLKTEQAQEIADFLTYFLKYDAVEVDQFEETGLVDLLQRLNVSLSLVANKEG